jgi:hypothetical protein
VAATVQALGDDPADLLARVQAVAPAQQFSTGNGYVIARSYAFLSADGSLRSRGAPPPKQVLSRGEVHAGGLVMGMNVPAVKGAPGDIHLSAAAGEPFELPEDLLAVIGWDWARLVRGSDGSWTSKRRLRGVGERRTRTAEAALVQAAEHLTRVLAAPPAQFHARYLGARWGVVLRRGIPTLTSLAMIIGVLLLPQLGDRGPAPKFWLALHYLPIGILAVAFSLQELPRFEIPPLPRRLRAPGWRRPQTQGA